MFYDQELFYHTPNPLICCHTRRSAFARLLMHARASYVDRASCLFTGRAQNGNHTTRNCFTKPVELRRLPSLVFVGWLLLTYLELETASLVERDGWDCIVVFLYHVYVWCMGEDAVSSMIDLDPK